MDFCVKSQFGRFLNRPYGLYCIKKTERHRPFRPVIHTIGFYSASVMSMMGRVVPAPMNWGSSPFQRFASV